jgi:hypothetical protein
MCNTHYGGQEVFLVVSTKTLQALCSAISQEYALNIGWGNFTPRTMSPIMWENIPLCGCKIEHTWNKGSGFQASLFLTSSKHTSQHTGWQETQSDHLNSIHVDKEINSLWFRTTLAHNGYTQWMLSIPYSEKLLPSPQWTAALRSTRHCRKPWSNQEGHSFPQRFSQGQNSTTFIHGTVHIKSKRNKAVPQSDFGQQPNLYTSVMANWTRNIIQSHTHTHSDDFLNVIS